MNTFQAFRLGFVRRISAGMRMLPFSRPDRAPGGPTLVDPPHRSAPPSLEMTDGDGSTPMESQHHVHPTDDDARARGSG